MNDSVLRLAGLKKSFGETDIIKGVDLEVFKGERHAIIGPNGAGKSTLFHLITGNLKPTDGNIFFGSERLNDLRSFEINRLGMARSFQITNIFQGLTVYENVRIAVMQKWGLQYNFWSAIGRHSGVNTETRELLTHVRLAAKQDALVEELSYSEQRCLEIAMTLASSPEVILLDEPMAGMSHEETTYMQKLILELTEDKTLLVVEHDMDVVFSISDRVSVLVYGEIIATGTPDEIKINPKVREAYLGEEE